MSREIVEGTRGSVGRRMGRLDGTWEDKEKGRECVGVCE